MARRGKKQVLRQRLSRGDYIVDPDVVAEAILRLAGHRTSSMFIACESGQDLPVGAEQDEPSPRRDLA
jgi:hypothetical protein